jgi:CRP/FNR family cyclic AMP-dependent transcriptional regulator
MTVGIHAPAVPGGLGANLQRVILSQGLSSSTVELRRRDVVYGCLAGDQNIYLVERGQLKAVTQSQDGKECLLAIYSAGDVFGELCLLGGQRTETVTAMTSAVVKRISAHKVLAALDDTALRDEFVKHLTERLQEKQLMIVQLVTADSSHRLAVILLDLARKLGKRDGHILCIEERITQEELSGMVGTTRSRVGYFLNSFCRAGLVARRGDCFLLVSEPRLADFIMSGSGLSSAARPSATALQRALGTWTTT